MKLVIESIKKEFIFDNEIKGYELIIENKKFRTDLLFGLYNQMLLGNEKPFILSDEKKIELLSLQKFAHVVIDPFSVDINNKNILNKIIKKLVSISTKENLYNDTINIEESLIKYAEKMIDSLSAENELTYQINIETVIKSMGIKFETDYDNFLHKLTSFISILREWTDTKLFIFYGIRDFLSNEEFNEFLKMLTYKDICYFIIEKSNQGIVEGLDKTIIDIDLCEI